MGVRTDVSVLLTRLSGWGKERSRMGYRGGSVVSTCLCATFALSRRSLSCNLPLSIPCVTKTLLSKVVCVAVVMRWPSFFIDLFIDVLLFVYGHFIDFPSFLLVLYSILLFSYWFLIALSLIFYGFCIDVLLNVLFMFSFSFHWFLLYVRSIFWVMFYRFVIGF